MTAARLRLARRLPAWRKHPHVPQSQRGMAPVLPAAAAAMRAVMGAACRGWRRACGPPCAQAASRWDQPRLTSLRQAARRVWPRAHLGAMLHQLQRECGRAGRGEWRAGRLLGRVMQAWHSQMP